MILNSLKITNFRQYMGHNEIKFAKSPEKSFTIIKGTNGAGKTTLLNAITWCLYGEELHNTTDDPIYNEITENITEPEGSFKVEVEVEMINDNAESITFKRSLNFYKDENGKIFDSIFDGSDFSVIKQDNKDNKPVTHPDLFIDKNMPKDIEEYFFFDGEKLEDYFKENTGKVIKKSVFKITQLELFKRLIDHLTKQKRAISDEMKKASPGTGSITQEINDNEDSLIENQKLLTNAINQRKIAEKNIRKYENELKKLDSSHINDLISEKENLERELDNLDKDIEDLERKKVDFILEMCPRILAYSPLNEAREETSELEEKGYIPADYKKKFLNDLLDEGICICGTKLDENEDCKRKLEELKAKTNVLTDISEEISKESVLIGNLLEKLKDFRIKQKDLGKDIKKNKKERDLKSTRISEISVLIKGSEVKKAAELQELLEENQAVKDRELREEGKLGNEIKNAKEKIDKLKKRRQKEIEKHKELENLGFRVQFCEEALEAAIKLKSRLIEDIRVRMEKETKEQFLKLNWKQTFVDVEIDDDYDVSVVRQSGRTSDANGLSAGEKLTLALAFMAALNEISGFNLPIIIDTPMGRLDKEIKLNIAEVLPKYLENKQITLLVTGEEYSPEFRSRLSSRVGKEYQIKVTETEEGNKSEVL